MAFSRSTVRATSHIIFTVWIVAVNLCGLDALIPSILQIPHHTFHTANLDCEEICISRGIALIDTAVEQIISKFPQPDTSAITVSSISVQGITAYHPLVTPSIPFPASIKRYQLTRSYRL